MKVQHFSIYCSYFHSLQEVRWSFFLLTFSKQLTAASVSLLFAAQRNLSAALGLFQSESLEKTDEKQRKKHLQPPDASE